jgi:hypothetical protein
MNTARRFSYVLLCCAPLLNFPIVGLRVFRVPGVCQAVGAAYFAALAFAAWTLGARAIASSAERERRLALAGMLLLVPSTLMALLWVGLGPPWEATAQENRMRYLVLLIDSVAVTAGLVVLEEALREAGERLLSTLGAALAILAGAAYLVWNCFFLGFYIVKTRRGEAPAAFASLSDSIDALIFIACVLTYLATLIFAACLGRIQWLGRGSTRAYVIANLFLLLLIVIKGVSFPDPTASSAPWYLNLAFIAGIPAVPWIMPYLFGVLLLRRAGENTVSNTV